MKGKHQKSVVAQRYRLESAEIDRLKVIVSEMEKSRQDYERAVEKEMQRTLAWEIERANAAVQAHLQAANERANAAETRIVERVLRVTRIVATGSKRQNADYDPKFTPEEMEELTAAFGGRYEEFFAIFNTEVNRTARRRRSRGSADFIRKVGQLEAHE